MLHIMMNMIEEAAELEAGISILEELMAMRRAQDRRSRPEQEMLTYENTVREMDVDWHSVDSEYIAQVAQNFFERKYKNDKVQSDVLTSHVLCALKKQRHNDILYLENVCCTNSNCKNVCFVEYVLKACKHVFSELQYF